MAPSSLTCAPTRHACEQALTLPTFFINSALDAWQLVNVWRRFARCRWEGGAGCASAQVDADLADTNAMLRAFVTALRSSGALDRRGNGAFISSCNEHVAGLAAKGYTATRIRGTTMREALSAWWAAADDAPAARHTYAPCELVRNGSMGEGGRRLEHHACNPSCSAYRATRRMRQECPCSPP